MTAPVAHTSPNGGGPREAGPAAAPVPPVRPAATGRRWVWRLGSVLGAGLLLTLYGWRYGFTKLPEPARKPVLDEETLFAPADLPATNFWYPIRALARAWIQTPPASATGAGTALDSRSLPPPPVRLRGSGWVHFRPATLPTEAELEAALQAALAAPDRRPPRELRAEDRLGMETLLLHLEYRAAATRETEDSVQLFEYWVATWQLYAALVPAPEFAGFFDERGSEMINVVLARPFRRQALKGPPLAPEAARRILAGLAEAGRRAPTPAEAYAREVLRLAEVWRTARVADWSRVTRSARVAGMLIRQDTVGLFGEVLDRISGWRRRAEPNYHGAAHLLRPLGELVTVLQIFVARAGDFDRMERACLGEILGGADGIFSAQPSLPPSLLRPETGPRAWLRRVLDRPAVWRLPRLLPPPEPVLESERQWRLYLESCRLTLALRGYRDRHGRWPDRLEALVPEWLEAVPEDPFAPGTPLRYSCTGESWQFWSVGGPGEAFAGPDRPRQQVFRSTEFDAPAPEPTRRSRR